VPSQNSAAASESIMPRTRDVAQLAGVSHRGGKSAGGLLLGLVEHHPHIFAHALGRFVRIWKVCCGQSSAMKKT
jgi:hypothetical protein